MPRKAIVTVIIATYHRPEALRLTLESIQAQDETRWQALVLGDCCTDHTEKTIAKLNDTRIRFINLPQRCQEQAIPNSIGMLLSSTPYIAFLNHDDILLPDHLSLAIKCLKDRRIDIYVAHSAFANRTKASKLDRYRPIFTDTNPKIRKLAWSFWASHSLFEPCSSWVFKRELIHQAGLWQSALELYRTPIQEWFMRLWRSKAKLYCSNTITCLKFSTHYLNKSIFAYSRTPDEQASILQKIKRLPAERIRRYIYKQLEITKRPLRFADPNPWQLETCHSISKRLLCRLLVNPLTGMLYYFAGIDSYSLYCQLTQTPKAALLKDALKARTAESLSAKPALSMLLHAARQQIATQEKIV